MIYQSNLKIIQLLSKNVFWFHHVMQNILLIYINTLYSFTMNKKISCKILLVSVQYLKEKMQRSFVVWLLLAYM